MCLSNTGKGSRPTVVAFVPVAVNVTAGVAGVWDPRGEPPAAAPAASPPATGGGFTGSLRSGDECRRELEKSH